MTDKTKREATCPKCGGVHYGTGPGCVYDKEWPKPPATEKAEWERLITDEVHALDCDASNNIVSEEGCKKLQRDLRAAVQQALDEGRRLPMATDPTDVVEEIERQYELVRHSLGQNIRDVATDALRDIALRLAEEIKMLCWKRDEFEQENVRLKAEVHMLQQRPLLHYHYGCACSPTNIDPKCAP